MTGILEKIDLRENDFCFKFTKICELFYSKTLKISI